MAHEIAMFTDHNGVNKYSFAYFKNHGDTWHGLGQSVETNNIDVFFEEAGFNTIRWEEKDLYLNDCPVENYKAIIRSDTGDLLSIVSDKFSLVQADYVLEAVRNIHEETGMEISSAGFLQDGKRVFACLKLGNNDITVDPVYSFLTVATSCDGKMATTAFSSHIRTVCSNTLSAGFKQTKNKVSLSHKGRSDRAIEIVDSFIKNIKDDYITMERMMNTKFSSDKAIKYFEQVAKITKQPSENKFVKNALANYKGMGLGSNLDTAKNTLWGALNATTEIFGNGTRNKDLNKWATKWFGRALTNNKTALKLAIKELEDA